MTTTTPAPMTAERLAEIQDAVHGPLEHPSVILRPMIRDLLALYDTLIGRNVTLTARVAELKRHVERLRKEAGAYRLDWLKAIDQRDSLAADLATAREALDEALAFMDGENIVGSLPDQLRQALAALAR